MTNSGRAARRPVARSRSCNVEMLYAECSHVAKPGHAKSCTITKTLAANNVLQTCLQWSGKDAQLLKDIVLRACVTKKNSFKLHSDPTRVLWRSPRYRLSMEHSLCFVNPQPLCHYQGPVHHAQRAFQNWAQIIGGPMVPWSAAVKLAGIRCTILFWWINAKMSSALPNQTWCNSWICS